MFHGQVLSLLKTWRVKSLRDSHSSVVQEIPDLSQVFDVARDGQ